MTDRVASSLTVAGAAPEVAATMSEALVRSEAEGNAACGLHYAPVFAGQLRAGRIDGHAVPIVFRTLPGRIDVDASHGFAHPAVATAMQDLLSAAWETGVAVMCVRRSTDALALSHLVQPIAEAEMIWLAFAVAPASMAPQGRAVPVVGTSSMAMAVPGLDGPAVVFDQSAGAVTKTRVILARQEGERVPAG